MLAVIRVITLKDEAQLKFHENIIKHYYHGKIRSYCIPNQPFGIYDDASELHAIPQIVDVAKQAEKDGAKAIVISCAADPALEEVRNNVKVPVLGAGTCAASMAAAIGRKVGVLNLSGATPKNIRNILGDKLTGERVPKGVCNTTDLNTAEGRQAAATELQELAQESDVILLACTGYTTIGLAKALRSEYSIPIIDAIEACGSMARLFETR